jgi:hypothetical protein
LLIDGIALSGYRSFGSYLQKIGPLRKINLIIGQNNSGKSNILRFLAHHYKPIITAIRSKKSITPKFSIELDRHFGSVKETLKFGFALNWDEADHRQLLLQKEGNAFARRPLLIKDAAKIIIDYLAAPQGSNCSWFIYKANTHNSLVELDSDLILQRNILA